MTKEQLRKIETVGLPKYVRLGNPLPSVELIKDYQAAVKGFCENSEKLPSGTYSSRGDQKVHKSSFYYNDETRKIVAFNMETQDLITASTYNPKDFAMFRVTKNLGRL